MFFEGLSSMFGAYFLGYPTGKLCASLVTLGKYAAACGAIYGVSKIPALVSNQSRDRSRMLKAFMAGGIYNVRKKRDFTDGQFKDIRDYPKIDRISRTDKLLAIEFKLPPGFSPDTLREKSFVFRQVFGPNAKLHSDGYAHRLEVCAPLPASIPYDYTLIERAFGETGGLPVFAGINQYGEAVAYDMRTKPHLGIVGVTGYGKSSMLRVLLCSWLQYFAPDELRLYLGDLKKTEFGEYHGVPHVEHIATKRGDVVKMLRKVAKLLEERSELLGSVRATNIDRYYMKTGERLPYVVVCIDEVALLQGESEAHEIIEEIAAIGRALGVFLVMSQQRVDKEVLNGRVKHNLTVRQAYRMSDAMNSRLFIDVDDASHISVPGRAIVKESDRVSEVQTPFLSEDEAEEIIERYRSECQVFDTRMQLTQNFAEADEIVFGELDAGIPPLPLKEVAATCERETKRS